MKTAFHPSGLKITFTPEMHQYIDDRGRLYTSATTFISRFFPKFEKEAVAQKCVENGNEKYAGMSVDEILMAWEAEATRGRNEGTNVHEYAENILAGVAPPGPISERCETLFKRVDEAINELLPFYQWVGSEVILFDPETLLAGQADLIMYHQKLKQLIILDWKQNKEISRSNRFQKGFKPVDHLEDTDINRYSLQLSFYEWLIRKGGYFPGVERYNRALIHLSEAEFKIIQLENYSYEIGEMIKETRDAGR